MGELIQFPVQGGGGFSEEPSPDQLVDAVEQDLSVDTTPEEDYEPNVKKREERTVSGDLVRVYLNEIGKVALLNAEDEVALAKRIEAGVFARERIDKADANDEKLAMQLRRDLLWIERDGSRAMDELLRANLRLVVSLAKRYTGHGMPFLDLIQEGNLGLIRAVEKFDYTKGFKFSTYATWWIRQAITRSLPEQSRSIHLPVHIVEKINLIKKAKRELMQERGRNPTYPEIAAEVDMTAERVVELEQIGKDALSLNHTQGEGSGEGRGDNDSEFLDMLEAENIGFSEDDVISALARHSLEKIIAETLKEREAEVLFHHFGLKGYSRKTLQEIAEIFGVTRERIRLIETIAKAKLRKSKDASALLDMLRT